MRIPSDMNEISRILKDAGFEICSACSAAESEKQAIRTVREPEEQFREHPEDILRVFRFAAQYGYEIDSHTLKAAGECRRNLGSVPAERKGEELTEIFCSDPRKILLMESSGVLEELIPQLHEAFFCDQNNPYHFTNVGMHTVLTAENTDPDPVLRWAAILHDLGKPEAKSTKDGTDHFYGHPEISAEIARRILHEYRFPDEFAETVISLAADHDRDMPSKKAVRRYLAAHDIRMLQKLLLLKIADALGHRKEKIPFLLSKIDQTVSQAEEVLKEKPGKTYALNDLALNGDDLIRAGIPQGPEIGRLLDLVHEAVMENPEMNTKEQLLALIHKRQVEI